jgi:hypothetical protein
MNSKTAGVYILVQAEPNTIFKVNAVMLASIIEKRPVEKVAVVPEKL